MKRLTVLLVFALAGCQQTRMLPMDTNYDAVAVAQQAKSLVVMRTMAKSPQGDDVAMATTWRNTKTNRYFVTHAQSRILFYNSPHDKVHAYTIEPGQYVLTDIIFTPRPFWSLGQPKTYYVRNIPPMVFFEVQPGEKTYVGDLISDTQQTRNLLKTLRIEDHYDAAIKGIKEEQPELDLSFGKRLMRFSDRAVILRKLREIDGGLIEDDPLT
jgi:hypothetical protein